MSDVKAPEKAPEKAAADAKAGTPADPAGGNDSVQTLAASIANLEQRTRLGTPAGATADLDRTVPGGKFRVRGKLVNAHGREIDDDGKLLHPEEQQLDPFGRKV